MAEQLPNLSIINELRAQTERAIQETWLLINNIGDQQPEDQAYLFKQISKLEQIEKDLRHFEESAGKEIEGQTQNQLQQFSTKTGESVE